MKNWQRHLPGVNLFLMPNRTSQAGSELFIVDNSDEDWKVRRYLHDWCGLSRGIDIATGYFEIGSLLALDGEWQKVDQIRILMGDEVSFRTKRAFEVGLANVTERLDASLEAEKEKNDFLFGVGATRDDAIRAAARHLGFARTGNRIRNHFDSIIRGVLKQGVLERDGNHIRRARA